ncbi:MAG: ankyrin repeat domain-containing protein [Spirochaetales bacterium]|nr:ankyrin repeat domain-containing protein [Spirochaetales bacterium]
MKKLKMAIYVWPVLAMIFACGPGTQPDAGGIFHYIAINQQEKVLELVQGGEDLEQVNNEGQTPLLAALDAGNLEMTRLLVQHGPNVNRKDKTGATPLGMAVKQRSASMVKLLLDAGADVNVLDGSGRSAVQAAVDNRRVDTEIINLLVAAGADRNFVNDLGSKQNVVINEKQIISQEKVKTDPAQLESLMRLRNTLNSFKEKTAEALERVEKELAEIRKLQASGQSGVKKLTDIIDEIEQAGE